VLESKSESSFLVPESESEPGVLNFLTLESESYKKQGLCFPASIRPSGSSLIPILRDAIFSLHSEGICMKRDANIQHVSANCWKGSQGHKSKVNVIARPKCTFKADGEPSTYVCPSVVRPTEA